VDQNGFAGGCIIALPFVLPSKQCHSEEFERTGFRFRAGFHNHFDRITRFYGDTSKPSAPIVSLAAKIPNGQSDEPAPEGWRQSREFLQSVATFEELAEYETSIEAFQAADKKIQACFDFLADHLGALQRALPYLVTWTVYPISVFDVYDQILKLEEDVRHKVVHRGLKPELKDAKECFRACCEVVRWLCDVAGYPKKDMHPLLDQSASGFAMRSGEPHVCSETEMETIARMMRVVFPQKQ
jgi:hypothetical protein